MRVGSLSRAMHRAVSSINDTFREVEKNAKNVASGIERDAGDPRKDVSRSLVEMPVLRRRVAANVRVINTADRLLDELARKPRR